MGYQKKGYTSGEIATAWIEDFDKLTKAKANGRHQLLVVDGHSSHFTMGFLEYARNYKITMLCYPSHSTHVYQGLDVVIFSVLKRAWSEERDKFEKSGPAVSKVNFLEVYAKAHVRAFTKENILAAFKKTGIVPFNPDVITDAMMAPSLETSLTTRLPLSLASPLQEVVDLLSCHRARKRNCEDLPDLEDKARHTPSQRLAPSSELDYTPVRRAMNGLASTSAAFLISNSPLLSSSHLPVLQTYEISPDRRSQLLLDMPPTTERELLLTQALEERNHHISYQSQVIGGLQAQSILHSAHVEDLRGQLQGQEEKKAKGQNKGRINMDGRPKILTQDEIMNAVVKAHAERDAKKDAAVKRKDAKAKYAEAIGIWKVREMDRKEQNSVLKTEWEKDVRKWEVEKNSAKCDRRKPRWTKPKMPTMEKPIPKPKVADFAEESESVEEENEGEDTSDGSDSD